MTPGTRLTSVLSHCLREESFALIVSPAIADLQFERAAMSHVTIFRSYIGIWQAFCVALCLDVAWNARGWVDDNLRRSTLHSRVYEMSPALLLASYVACAVIFFSDVTTGAQRLSRSALVHDPTLRAVAATALTVLSAAAFLSVLNGISKRLIARPH